MINQKDAGRVELKSKELKKELKARMHLVLYLKFLKTLNFHFTSLVRRELKKQFLL
jgi:hypothetical protein